MPSDPQFTVMTILRPYLGFEAVYQGQPAGVPGVSIALTPGGEALDPLVGKPGYDPRLVKGYPVAMGQRVLLWLPFLVSLVEGAPNVQVGYRYGISWRIRSKADFDNSGGIIPWHNPTQLTGVPDGVDPRFAIYAGSNSIVYNEVEPGGLGSVFQNLRVEGLTVAGNPAQQTITLLKNGQPGAFQQGVEPVTVGNSYIISKWQLYETQAAGDEMILTVGRASYANATTWDFTAGQADGLFSDFFGEGLKVGGYPTNGALVFVGAAP